jgi:hypothetical protein
MGKISDTIDNFVEWFTELALSLLEKIFGSDYDKE